MGSETEGGVLDIIHYGNKTDVDICRISLVEKNTSDQYKKKVLLGYDRLHKHHSYSTNEDPPGSATSGNL
jgi:hypothetical protein